MNEDQLIDRIRKALMCYAEANCLEGADTWTVDKYDIEEEEGEEGNSVHAEITIVCDNKTRILSISLL